MIKINKQSLSIFIIWLFAISGVLGIQSSYKDWFLSLTPLHLSICFFIVFWHIKTYNLKLLIAFSIPFFLGFITEALGVNYGLIFGNYSYGNNLGVKILGVPVIICLNWVLLTVITTDISKFISKNKIISSFLGALLMTGLDVIIEVSAPRFDFWEFNNGIVPLQNYVGWLIVAFIAHLGYQNFNIKTNKIISLHVFISIAVFFTMFLFF